MEPQKVKVEEAYYDSVTDSVCWVVKLGNGKRAELVFLREDFGSQFKIDPDIPEPLIQEFCRKVLGKEITLVIGG